MKRSLIATLWVALFFTPLHAAAQAPSDRWTFSLQPYLWAPSIDANLRYGPPSAGGATPNVEVDAQDILQTINFALMLQAEARKGRWLIGTDLIYLDQGNESSVIRSIDFNPGSGPVNVATTQLNANTQTAIDSTIWTLVGGYNLVQESTATLDLIAGFRYARVKARTDWVLTAAVTGPVGAQSFARAGSIEKTADLTDAIIGARGRVRLGESSWFMPYHVDIGTGESDLTWQGLIGIGYGFKWGDVTLSYRYLYYKEGNNDLLQKLTFGGPALSANFRF